MNPEQIAIVVGTWQAAGRDGPRLLTALAARLPDDGTPPPIARAEWIVDAVSLLSPMIDRPTRFTRAADALVHRRAPVTMSELGADQAALLGALAELLGPLDAATERAWALALKLFEETIADTCLDPFGAAHEHGGVA